MSKAFSKCFALPTSARSPATASVFAFNVFRNPRSWAPSCERKPFLAITVLVVRV